MILDPVGGVTRRAGLEQLAAHGRLVVSVRLTSTRMLSRSTPARSRASIW
ncbi:hypothetical protein [Streptomyces sp. NPDC018833]